MNYIIFGGSGFIGTHLTELLINKLINTHDNIYILDLVLPRIDITKYNNVFYVKTDVRNSIELSFHATADDIIFNLAAIHRTPGHHDIEYFETNIKGAQNITAFANQNNINSILFTSSIAVYGASEEKKFETTLLTPNTPYGISKAIAETIHEKWQLQDKNNRCLTVLRPGVVFGKGENGNFTRMIKSIKGKYFFYPGRKDTIKACIYVKELINFFQYRMIDHKFVGCDTFNCTYEPAYTVEEICTQIKSELSLNQNTYVFPASIMILVAYILVPFLGKNIGIHPQRVKKLMNSTNISGVKMHAEEKNGYKELYNFKQALHELIS